MWDLIVSVSDHCLSFYFDESYNIKSLECKQDFRYVTFVAAEVIMNVFNEGVEIAGRTNIDST